MFTASQWIKCSIRTLAPLPCNKHIYIYIYIYIYSRGFKEGASVCVYYVQFAVTNLGASLRACLASLGTYGAVLWEPL